MAAKMLPRKLNIEQHEPLAPLPRKQNKQKTGVNVVAPEGKAVPAPIVTPVVLIIR